MSTPAFCASCTEERSDLVPEWMNGRKVHLCRDCREGKVRGGSYSFAGGREINGLKQPPAVNLPRMGGSKRARLRGDNR